MFGPQVALCDERHLSASKDPEAATIIKRLMSPDDQLGRHLRATAGKLTQARQAGAARFRFVQKLLEKRGCANRQGGPCAIDEINGRCLIPRSEEHTSEPVTNAHLVCRLLLETKKNDQII